MYTKIRKTASVIGISLILVFLFSVMLYRIMPPQRIAEGTYLADLDLSNLYYDEAAEKLDRRIAQLKTKPVVIQIKDRDYEFSLEELGVEFDQKGTIDDIKKSQQGENFFHSASIILDALAKDTLDVKPKIQSTQQSFQNAIELKIPEISQPQDAQIVLNPSNNLEVIEHKDGLRVLYPRPYQDLLSSVENLQVATLSMDSEILGAHVTTEVANQAVQEGLELLKQDFILKYDKGYGENTYKIELDESWLEFYERKDGTMKASLKKDWLLDYLNRVIAAQLNIEMHDAVIKSLPEEGSAYPVVEGKARQGRILNVERSVEAILQAVEEGKHEAYLDVSTVEGKIFNETGKDLGELTLLSTGMSNFKGSPPGRSFNIRKGLNEKVNNVLVAPGEIYDFNKNLGPVTYSAGWQSALAIFVGRDFEPVPGGGLCQVSTTTYRAAVKAGLPIIEKNNHTFYIHFYEEYGNGLDAAIYPGFQNMTFKNDTGNYIFIQAYDDGYDAIVNIYGTPDGRDVELVGPIYPNAIPDELRDKVTLKDNQIGWLQTIRNEAGAVLKEEQLTGTYRVIPKEYRNIQ